MSSHNDARRELRKVNRAFDFIQGLEKNILGFNTAPETTDTPQNCACLLGKMFGSSRAKHLRSKIQINHLAIHQCNAAIHALGQFVVMGGNQGCQS